MISGTEGGAGIYACGKGARGAASAAEVVLGQKPDNYLVLFSVVLDSETGNKRLGWFYPQADTSAAEAPSEQLGRRHKCLLHPLGLGILRTSLRIAQVQGLRLV